jgi:hypothetical protein
MLGKKTTPDEESATPFMMPKKNLFAWQWYESLQYAWAMYEMAKKQEQELAALIMRQN